MSARLIALASIALLLSGCSAEPEALTLVETKSPVQLLRNEAWYRLPEVMIKGDSETTDVSVACDSDGYSRSWQSSTVALLNNSFAPRARGVAEALTASFEEQGWVATSNESPTAVVTLLVKTSSVAHIEIEATDKTSEHRATVRITATGPCVDTAGPDSDEVRDLEQPQ